MPLFGKRKEKERKKGVGVDSRKPPSPESQSLYGQRAGRSSASPKPSPSSSLQNLAPSRSGASGRGTRHEKDFSGSVKDKVSQYEQQHKKAVSSSYTSLNSRERSVISPPPSSSAATSQHGSHASLLRPEGRSQAGSSVSSVASPASDQVVPSTSSSSATKTSYPPPSSSYGLESPPPATESTPSTKSYDSHSLPLPPLQTATVQHRSVVAEKTQQNGGGFGFILRQSYLPVPDDPGQTRLVHLVEPRPDYTGPLMTGDRIIEVNGCVVEDEPHDRVVELIKASGDRVELMVASMPELLELNARVFQGSDNPFANRGNKLRKSARMKPGQTGTLRKQAAMAKKEFKVSLNILTLSLFTKTCSGLLLTTSSLQLHCIRFYSSVLRTVCVHCSTYIRTTYHHSCSVLWCKVCVCVSVCSQRVCVYIHVHCVHSLGYRWCFQLVFAVFHYSSC